MRQAASKTKNLNSKDTKAAKKKPQPQRPQRKIGLILDKIAKTHRYQVTKAGRVAILAVLAVQQTTLTQLNLAAAA